MSEDPVLPGPILAIDTSTHHSVVALSTGPDSIRSSVVDVGRRHGASLLEQIDRLLGDAGLRPEDVDLIVAGTGPGSFTGLRVGLAIAKTIAYVTGAPIVGVASSDALRSAAIAARVAGAEAVVVLPAGAHDHYVAAHDAVPELIAPGALTVALAGREAIAVGVPADLVGEEAVRRGEMALEGLPDALLALGSSVTGAAAGDAATLVPGYVALPRGIATEETGWSPDLRSA
ncbi:MAG: tRNA (adenosine(37)-N6)-threonylcarbamoyltransferase complex dimerization subunit type 1 TsaB [Chloroflexota bacterium]